MYVPHVIFALCSLAAAGCVLLLPETLGHPLPRDWADVTAIR